MIQKKKKKIERKKKSSKKKKYVHKTWHIQCLCVVCAKKVISLRITEKQQNKQNQRTEQSNEVNRIESFVLFHPFSLFGNFVIEHTDTHTQPSLSIYCIK